jgi:hypothetical protein
LKLVLDKDECANAEQRHGRSPELALSTGAEPRAKSPVAIGARRTQTIILAAHRQHADICLTDRE